MFFRHPALSITLIVAVSATSGCRYLRPVNPNQPKAPESAKPAAAADAPKPGPSARKAAPKPSSAKDARTGLTDPNIAAMVLASNNTDISYARLVPTRAERPDVKEFAQRMLTDHTGINALVNDLLNKLNVTPVDNAASLDMRDESANRRDVLRELVGYSFDSTYIENEVAYHQRFLISIDSIMLPAAKNTELKGLLTAVRPAVAAHLAHAEQVRANVISKK